MNPLSSTWPEVPLREVHSRNTADVKAVEIGEVVQDFVADETARQLEMADVCKCQFEVIDANSVTSAALSKHLIEENAFLIATWIDDCPKDELFKCGQSTEQFQEQRDEEGARNRHRKA